MPPDSKKPAKLSLFHAARERWQEMARHQGKLAASGWLVAALWEFLCDSTPERRRMRYGDADYDWEQRVNTTSAAVGWRDRLLGAFHSPYQPTDPALFREMMEALQVDPASQQGTNFDFSKFTFVDLGSGKGRALLLASDYPFRRIVGVELMPSLHEITLENIAKYHSETQRCFHIESICADAAEFSLPQESLMLYLFNPLPEPGLRHLLLRLERSLHEHPRPIYVLYHNPLLEHVLAASASLKKLGGTHQYVLYSNT